LGNPVLRAEEHAFQVDCYDLVKVLSAGLKEVAYLADARVIYEDV
jgi:hypothetical protein